MCLVQDAINARLPIITVTSNDPFYDTAIICHMASQAKRLLPSNPVASTEKLLSDNLIGRVSGTKQANAHGNKVVCYTGKLDEPSWKDIYTTAMEKKSTVVVLLRNGEQFDLGYQAGVLNPPESMVFDALKPFCEDIYIPQAIKALQGLQLSDVQSVLRLTMARAESITSSAIRQTRKAFVGGVRGLQLVETKQAFYQPDHDVAQWITINANPFIKATMRDLIPRGLLLKGVAGTGKTAGAKYIAWCMDVELVRVDMPSMMSKWSGDAEANLDHALATLEQMSPCVALFDEVEKVVSTNDEDGSSKRMLAKLLWWLQEKSARVLVVMTTNRLKDLPPELYRAGRIDQVLTLDGMVNKPDNISKFTEALSEPFVKEGLKVPTGEQMVSMMQTRAYHVVDDEKQRDQSGIFVSQAEITSEFINRVKALNFSA